MTLIVTRNIDVAKLSLAVRELARFFGVLVDPLPS